MRQFINFIWPGPRTRLRRTVTLTPLLCELLGKHWGQLPYMHLYVGNFPVIWPKLLGPFQNGFMCDVYQCVVIWEYCSTSLQEFRYKEEVRYYFDASMMC